MVVDFGTSTNIDVVSAKGEFLGGALAPGIEISLEALATRAAALRTVELVRPRSVIGKNTVECLQSGVLYGFAGQVDGLVRRILAELGGRPGHRARHRRAAPLMADESETITEYVPDLTLLGLRLTYLRNARSVPDSRPADTALARTPQTWDRAAPEPVPPAPTAARRTDRSSRADAGAAGEAGRDVDAGHDPYPVAVAAHAQPARGPRRPPRPAAGHRHRRRRRRHRAGDLPAQHRQALLRHPAGGRRHPAAGHAEPGPGRADELARWKATVDLGDHVFVQGEVITSRRGELSVMVDRWQMTAKAMRPLPVAHRELSEETRVRQRYVDLIVRPQARDMVRAAGRGGAHPAAVLHDRGFVEVETPMLQLQHGGATARPFVTHANAIDSDLYLRIAPELFLKRCVVGGIERVFEINRNFRNEGIDSSHSPEFAMLEAYQAYATYDDMAELTRDWYKRVPRRVRFHGRAARRRVGARSGWTVAIRHAARRRFRSGRARR